jgi:hypothetical protein
MAAAIWPATLLREPAGASSPIGAAEAKAGLYVHGAALVFSAQRDRKFASDPIEASGNLAMSGRDREPEAVDAAFGMGGRLRHDPGHPVSSSRFTIPDTGQAL